VSGRRAKQVRRLLRMAAYGDRVAQQWVLKHMTRGEVVRKSLRQVAVEARRAGRQAA
jgi:hypothetical protein